MIVFKNYILTLLKANPQCSHVSYSNEMKLRLFKFTLKFKPMIENKNRESKETELLRQKKALFILSSCPQIETGTL